MIHKTLKAYKSQLENYLNWLWVKWVHTDNIVQAFTHKSFAYDHIGYDFHNERLEFVWDAILAWVVAKKLFEDYPWVSEFELTLRKIYLIREESLANQARNILLPNMIILGKWETRASWHLKDKILADCMEALIGYIYMYIWYEQAYEFIEKYIYQKIDDINTTKNYKTLLQEYVQKLYKNVPTYIDSSYELDSKGGVITYKSEIFIQWKKYWEGYGSSKKKSQEDAAKKVYNEMIV